MPVAYCCHQCKHWWLLFLLSTKETNATALKLYHKYHFAETGEMNDDEIVLQLNL